MDRTVYSTVSLPQDDQRSRGGRSGLQRDRWGDIYANTPTKKMIALYDYDPLELSPNVDSEVRRGVG